MRRFLQQLRLRFANNQEISSVFILLAVSFGLFQNCGQFNVANQLNGTSSAGGSLTFDTDGASTVPPLPPLDPHFFDSADYQTSSVNTIAQPGRQIRLTPDTYSSDSMQFQSDDASSAYVLNRTDKNSEGVGSLNARLIRYSLDANQELKVGTLFSFSVDFVTAINMIRVGHYYKDGTLLIASINASNVYEVHLSKDSGKTWKVLTFPTPGRADQTAAPLIDMVRVGESYNFVFSMSLLKDPSGYTVSQILTSNDIQVDAVDFANARVDANPTWRPNVTGYFFMGQEAARNLGQRLLLNQNVYSIQNQRVVIESLEDGSVKSCPLPADVNCGDGMFCGVTLLDGSTKMKAAVLRTGRIASQTYTSAYPDSFLTSVRRRTLTYSDDCQTFDSTEATGMITYDDKVVSQGTKTTISQFSAFYPAQLNSQTVGTTAVTSLPFIKTGGDTFAAGDWYVTSLTTTTSMVLGHYVIGSVSGSKVISVENDYKYTAMGSNVIRVFDLRNFRFVPEAEPVTLLGAYQKTRQVADFGDNALAVSTLQKSADLYDSDWILYGIGASAVTEILRMPKSPYIQTIIGANDQNSEACYVMNGVYNASVQRVKSQSFYEKRTMGSWTLSQHVDLSTIAFPTGFVNSALDCNQDRVAYAADQMSPSKISILDLKSLKLTALPDLPAAAAGSYNLIVFIRWKNGNLQAIRVDPAAKIVSTYALDPQSLIWSGQDHPISVPSAYANRTFGMISASLQFSSHETLVGVASFYTPSPAGISGMTEIAWPFQIDLNTGTLTGVVPPDLDYYDVPGTYSIHSLYAFEIGNKDVIRFDELRPSTRITNPRDAAICDSAMSSCKFLTTASTLTPLSSKASDASSSKLYFAAPGYLGIVKAKLSPDLM